jgi:8-oxo-dGTP pyrophosphatase MutT (NUDIX family)
MTGVTETPLFVSSDADLQPVDAAAAIIIDADGRYLMQLRDAAPQIFYPGHWGCFGGAVDFGEDPLQALRRELAEELELEAQPSQVSLFTRFDFDFSPLGKRKVYRIYYDVRIDRAQQLRLRLHEGQAMDCFSGPEILSLHKVAPYDAFALWMHHCSMRPSASPARHAGR